MQLLREKSLVHAIKMGREGMEVIRQERSLANNCKGNGLSLLLTIAAF